MKTFAESYNDNRTGFSKRKREDDEYHVPDPTTRTHKIGFHVSKDGGEKHHRTVTISNSTKSHDEAKATAKAHLEKQGYKIHEDVATSEYKVKKFVGQDGKTHQRKVRPHTVHFKNSKANAEPEQDKETDDKENMKKEELQLMSLTQYTEAVNPKTGLDPQGRDSNERHGVMADYNATGMARLGGSGKKAKEKSDKEDREREQFKEHAPVAPTIDRKYIKGTPEWKAHKEKSKPINGHPTTCKEEVEQIDEISRDTLLSYANKVSLDSQKHSKDPTRRSPEKANRSVAGYAKAHNRLDKPVKEEAELEEGYVVRYNNPKSEKHGSEKHFGDQAAAQKHADRGNSIDKIGGKYTVHKTNEKGHDVNEATDTVTKDKNGNLISFKHEGDWKKADLKKNPEGKVHNLAGQALKKTKELTKEEAEAIEEKAPPGFEGTVKAMKKHPEIDNPYALAWSMKNKGAKSHRKADGSVKEETMKSYKQFVESLQESLVEEEIVEEEIDEANAFDWKSGGHKSSGKYDIKQVGNRTIVTRKYNPDTGHSTGTDEPEKTEKRGRGRPAGSKSGAKQQGSGKSSDYRGIPQHSLNLPK
jgi:hypothetical protein